MTAVIDVDDFIASSEITDNHVSSATSKQQNSTDSDLTAVIDVDEYIAESERISNTDFDGTPEPEQASAVVNISDETGGVPPPLGVLSPNESSVEGLEADAESTGPKKVAPAVKGAPSEDSPQNCDDCIVAEKTQLSLKPGREVKNDVCGVEDCKCLD